MGYAYFNLVPSHGEKTLFHFLKQTINILGVSNLERKKNHPIKTILQSSDSLIGNVLGKPWQQKGDRRDTFQPHSVFRAEFQTTPPDQQSLASSSLVINCPRKPKIYIQSSGFKKVYIIIPTFPLRQQENKSYSSFQGPPATFQQRGLLISLYLQMHTLN